MPQVPLPTTTTDSTDRRTLVLLVVLTFSTGMVDAIGFLGLDKIFAGNMTGNVVVIGMSLGGGDLPVVGPTAALMGFVTGAAVAGFALRAASPKWGRRTTALLVITGSIISASGGVFLIVDSASHAVELSVSFALGAAMGIQAASARVLAVADVTTVVVTSTLVGLMADQFTAGKRTRQVRRVVVVVVMILGAIVGALLLKVDLGLSLAVTGVVTLATAAAGAIWVGR